MSGKRGISVKILGIALLVTSLAFTASLGSVSAANASSHGIVTFAEQPEAPPNYIFPMQSAVYLNFTNAS